METDEVLYGRYQNGDGEALKELVERYNKGLTFFLYNMVGNMSDAEDLFMETFAQLLAKKMNFEGRSSFKTWLYAIGRNTALKFLRSRQFFFNFTEEISTEHNPGPDYSVIQTDTKKMLYETLGKLKEEYREALCLIYFENMTYAQAGVIMQKTEKQITNLVYRAKISMRQLLHNEGYEYENG